MSEVHLDFDARSDQLVAYASLLGAVREVIGSRRLTITALPDWLGRPGFGAVRSTVDVYVMQVHWLEPPRHEEDPLSLMSAAQTRAWVDAASALGSPFRVALPTYGYRVGYDARSGVAVGVHAEQGRAPRGTRWREVRADPAEIAPLVAAWSADRPVGLEGLSWYRLPVAGDALNWRWETLAAVMEGVVPQPGLVAVVQSEGALSEVVVRNQGTAGAAVGAVSVTVPAGAAVVAADGLGGVRWDGHDFVAGGPVWVAPGEEQVIGWLRLSAPVVPEVVLRRPHPD